MQEINPACYECPKTNNEVHWWLKNSDGTSMCTKCKLKLNKKQTEDVWRE